MNGHHILQILILMHLGYSAGFGWRLQINRASNRQSKICERRSPLRQFENPLHSGKKNNFLLWLDISLIILMLNILVILYVLEIQYSFAYFTVKTKAYNVIISHTVQLWLLFKMLFLLVWILLLTSKHHCKVGDLFYEPPGTCISCMYLHSFFPDLIVSLCFGR